MARPQFNFLGPAILAAMLVMRMAATGATIVATIELPQGSAPLDVAVNEFAGKLYVACHDAKRVYIIDMATNNVVGSIPSDFSCFELHAGPGWNRLYVGAGPATQNHIQVIDVAAQQIIETLAFQPPGEHATDSALRPNSNELWEGTWESSVVRVFDLVTHEVAATVEVGTHPAVLGFSPNGAKAYVGVELPDNDYHDELCVIDAAARSVIARIEVGHTPCSIALSPDGIKGYLSCHDFSGLWVIDLLANAVDPDHPEGVPVKPIMRQVVLSPDGATAYLSCRGATPESSPSSVDLVAVIDIASLAVVQEIQVPDRTSAIALAPALKRLYVSSPDTDKITVVDVSDRVS